MKNPRGFRSGQSGNLTCDILGDFKILWEMGWSCYFEIKYPPRWKLQKEVLFNKEILCVMGNFANDLFSTLFHLCPTS
jgi:hypothetical protein